MEGYSEKMHALKTATHYGKSTWSHFSFHALMFFSTMCPQECLKVSRTLTPAVHFYTLLIDCTSTNRKGRLNKCQMTLLSDTNAHPVACVISYWVNHEVCQCWFHYSFLAICLIRLNTACVETFGTKLLCNHIFQNYCANHIVSKTKQLLIMQGWASTVPKSCLSSYAIFEESLSFDFQLRFLSRQYVM